MLNPISVEAYATQVKVIFEPAEEVGDTVYVPPIAGYTSEGETEEEEMANINEAIELY